MVKGKSVYVVVIALVALATLTFRPGEWLIHKPASEQNAHYVKGWEDGCVSGTNSYSLLYAPLMKKPFVKDIDLLVKDLPEKDMGAARDFYKSGWNEGFTLCRFYQSSVYELMQFVILIATLLFIGFLMTRKR